MRLLLHLTLLAFICLPQTPVFSKCASNVIGNTPDKQIIDNHDGTVSDLSTGLMWKKCLEGAYGDNCTSSYGLRKILPYYLSWYQAMNRAKVANKARYAGYNNWRLPNIKELLSILDPTCPAGFNENFPHGYGILYVWSSTPYYVETGSHHGAWAFNSANFATDVMSRAFDEGNARLVRDIKGNNVSKDCDAEHLYLCTSESSCTSAEGNWDDIEKKCEVEDQQFATVSSNGQTWMDRNLGANRVPISMLDEEGWGDIYQHGRGTDGHEKRTSAHTVIRSQGPVPGHSEYIVLDIYEDSQNGPGETYEEWSWIDYGVDRSGWNLWNGTEGTNNPCPEDFRLPTNAEFQVETDSWGSLDKISAYDSPLKLTPAGRRKYDGGVNDEGIGGCYYSNTGVGLSFGQIFSFRDDTGCSVRCIQQACDSSHLDLCLLELDCTTASGYWWSDNTCNSTPEPASCDSSHLNFCTTEGTCTAAGGYWWWSYKSCNSTDEPPVHTVTSAGQIWMDRNLGASRVATSSTDIEAYGDLYQWGRDTDGHEKRTSDTTTITSDDDIPDDGKFIVDSNDWRTTQNNDLWQGVSGINNPCPAGFRLPTSIELDAERTSWNPNPYYSDAAFASPLKLVMAGDRFYDGRIEDEGWNGQYWSSTVDSSSTIYTARNLLFLSSRAFMRSNRRAAGFSIRCFKD